MPVALKIYCANKDNCKPCRDPDPAGRHWREGLHPHLSPPPEGGIDWTCPYGLPWHAQPQMNLISSAEADAANLAELERLRAAMVPLYHKHWDEFHEKTDPDEAWLKDWIERIPGACSCREKARAYFREHKPDFSREGWRLCSVDFHNHVNVDIGKPPMSFETVARARNWPTPEA